MRNDGTGSFEEMRENRRVLAFDIGDDMRLVACVFEEILEDGTLAYRDMGIHIERGGALYTLASVEYRPATSSERGFQSLRTHLYEYGNDTAIGEFFSMKHRSIWLSHHEDAYAVNVWDEDNDARDISNETGDITTLEGAEKIMRETMEDNPQFLWTRRPMRER